MFVGVRDHVVRGQVGKSEVFQMYLQGTDVALFNDSFNVDTCQGTHVELATTLLKEETVLSKHSGIDCFGLLRELIRRHV